MTPAKWPDRPGTEDPSPNLRELRHGEPPGLPALRECGAALMAKRSHETRKTVTIVFPDLKATSPTASRLWRRTLRDVMARAFAQSREALARHGGTVEKFIGDAVMAVFGLPVRHEDDALRAVRAALDMRRDLTALSPHRSNATRESTWTSGSG